ncbi:MAG: VCBS repeat-containing protein, partial [Planctomycetes bacterium]|nr:VCBS repeat-containing protein [Planctomycetota bacterium]
GPPGKDVRFGHGRINAAAALRSVSPDATQFPELRITTPTGGQVVNEPLVVEGRAAGASFASYRLDYLPPGGDAFLLLRTSSAAVVDGPLGTLTPQPGWSDGFGAVRLTVTDTAGGTFRTAVGFRYRTTELEAPAPYAEFSGGDPVSIRGTAGGEGFRSYTLDYGAGAAPTAWTPIHSATRAVAGGLLGSWAPPAGLPDGVYTLRLRAEFSAGTRVATTAVVVERARLDGWPRTLSPSAWGFNDTPRVVPLAAGNRLLAGYGPGIGVFLGYVPRDLPFLALKAYDAQGAPVTGFDPAYPVFGSRVGTPAVGDLDRDGTPELAVLAQCTPPTGVEWRVFVLDPDGAIRWSRRVGVGEVGLFEALVALADLDGDGFLDVVCGGGPSAGTLQAFDRRGAPLEGFPVQVPGAKLLPERFAVADLDGDGGLEVAFWVRTQDDGHRLCVYRADGSVYPGVQPELGRFSGIFHPVGPVAGDLDGDGTLDLVAAGWGGSERKVFALRPDGRSLPGWPASDPPGHVTGLSLGDLDGDGKLEVVITNHSGGFQAFEHDGTLSAIRGGAAGEGVRGSSPLLADFDGDGRLDVVYRAVHQVAQPAGAARPDPLWVPRIVGYRADGQPLRGFPKQAAQPAIRGAGLRSSGGLTLGDLSGDGRLELLVGTSSMAEATTGGRVLGRVVAYATGLRADRRQVAWGTYHGNSHNTGVGAEPPAPTPDTTPPQVAILRPASGGKVFVLARIELEVSDDVLVERVELQVDGVAVATLSEAPFAFDWRPGAREPGPARIRAVAYDPAGNQASAEVEVEVTRLVREVEPTQRAPVRNPKRTPSPVKQPLGGG